MSNSYLRNIRNHVGSDILLIPGVAAAVLNDQNQLLLQEKHNETWSLPAGMIEPGESPTQALEREILEETGLRLQPTKLLGVFGGHDFRYRYPNGDLVEYTVILMRCKCNTHIDEVNNWTDNETKSLKYFSQKNMPPLALPYPMELLYSDNGSPIVN